MFEYSNPGSGTATLIDGDYGPATDLAVKNYQSANGKSRTGIVSPNLFRTLCQPLHNAFVTRSTQNTLRQRIISIASTHIAQQPRELDIGTESNMGPWVRNYMDSKNGSQWFWCVGFVQSIIDQALSEIGADFRNHMPLTYSCDDLGNYAHINNHLIRKSVWRSYPTAVIAGDILLIRKSYWDWTHTGIILNVRANDGLIETIEGNTNDDVSRNGYGVFQRIRNFSNLVLISSP